jgi:uncharacterized protein (TIGR00369 family)
VEAIKGEEMETQVQGLAETLQMTVVEATPQHIVMTMPVTAQHFQPWGYLHGGASVALAETAATVGAFLNGCVRTGNTGINKTCWALLARHPSGC